MKPELHLPSSLNPQAKYSTPLSPIHFLTSQKHHYIQNLSREEKKLEMHVEVLKQHIENKRKHREVISKEIRKQKQKIQFWKSNFEKAQKQYGEKIQKVQQLKSNLQKKEVKKMKNDYQEEFEQQNTDRRQRQKIILKPSSVNKSTKQNQANYSFQRIKSIVLKNKEMKRGQTLSLTHLHHHH